MLRKISNSLIDFLFPKECLVCKKAGSHLCQKCLKSISYRETSCPNCNKANSSGEFCLKCKESFNLKGVLIAGNFNDKNLEKLIKSFKYKFIEDLGESLGMFLFYFLTNKIETNPIIEKIKPREGFKIKDYLIVPLPLSRKRFKWRGFNQSEILARFIQEKLNSRISFSLIKNKNTMAQAKLDQEERKSNLKNCFEWKGEKLKDEKVIIIDDVYTTGTSLNEAAKVLKRNGAEEVWALVLAK
jgi:competence protein ComFC